MNTKIKSNIFEMFLEPGGDEICRANALPSKINVSLDWREDSQEGQLAVDVLENEKEILVISTMAGAIADKIEIYIHSDLLTVRGFRGSPAEKEKQANYFYQECFWGKFSRTIVLPVDVKGELAAAEYRNGILIVRIPKRAADRKIPVEVADE